MRKIIIAVAALVFVALAFVRLHKPYAGIPFTHKWRKSRQCQDYAKKKGGTFTSGSDEPIETETFFSERLGTCVQAQTFSPANYSIVDLSNDYSDDDWLLICGPQGLYKTSFVDRTRGKWIEDGMSPGRPCEKLFNQTLDEIQ
jgi:hypothetical protein